MAKFDPRAGRVSTRVVHPKPGTWPGGEPKKVRDAYDQLADKSGRGRGAKK